MLTRIFWYKEKKRNRKSFISQRKENNAQLKHILALLNKH